MKAHAYAPALGGNMIGTFATRLIRCSLLSASVVAMAATAAPAAAQAQVREFDIPAQPLSSAVLEFSRQSEVMVILSPQVASGIRSRVVRGRMQPSEAIGRLLRGTGLRAYANPSGGYRIGRATGDSLGESQAGNAAADDESADIAATPDILVVGQRTQNVDIRRTEDDAQPYVVFDRAAIERSQANTVEDFFRTQLPMNSVPATNSMGANNTSGPTSGINLRGLGVAQTLVLVDGRRVAGRLEGGGISQPDVNAIPLASIERIEVLPSGAGGIYGGGATGGVVNIITRRDFRGIQIQISHGDTFDLRAGNWRVDVSGGLRLGPNTNITFAASHAETSNLLVNERSFARRARELQFANNPGAFLDSDPPPVGTTANIRSQDGSDLILDNGTQLNSPITFVPIGYSGVGTDAGQALVANAGRFNIHIPDDINGGRQSLLNGPTVNSASASIRHTVASYLDLYADLSWYQNNGRAIFGGIAQNVAFLDADAPNNPFSTPITVSFPTPGLFYISRTRSEELRASLGAILRLGRGWSASADYSWSRSRTSFQQTDPALGDPDGDGPGLSVDEAYANGTLDVLRDLNAYPLDYGPYQYSSPNNVFGPADITLQDASVRIAGPVHLPLNRRLNVTGLLEWRRTYAEDAFQFGQFDTTFFGARSQTVWSGYAEAVLPIFSDLQDVPLLRSLELRASVRHDSYRTQAPSPSIISLADPNVSPDLEYRSNRFSATKFTAGFRYVPVEGVMLRGSFANGFLPPAVNQIAPNPAIVVTTSITDPKRGNVSRRVGPISLLLGGNENLIPEKSESYSLGIVLTPSILPGFRASLDYTHIEKVNEITGFGFRNIVALEDLLPGRVTRAALTAADAASGFTGGAITAIDATLLNVSSSRVEAFDAQFDYSRHVSGFGDISFYIIATAQPTLVRRVNDGAPAINFAGFTGSVLRYRGNVGAVWRSGPIEFSWNAQYYHRYRAYSANASVAAQAAATLNQGAAFIPSQTYHDLQGRYRFGDEGFLSGLEVVVGVENIFNARPPLVATTGVGGYSMYGDPRLRRFTLTARKTF